MFKELSELDSDNLALLEHLSFSRQLLIEALLARNDFEPASAETKLLGEEVSRLLNSDARKPKWSLRLKGHFMTNRLLLASPRDLSRLQAEVETFLQHGQPQIKKQEPTTIDALALSHLVLGDSLPAEHPRAKEHWQSALDLWSSIGGEPEWRVICWRAHALIRLGRTQEARTLADNLEASAFRHPAYADLKRRLPS